MNAEFYLSHVTIFPDPYVGVLLLPSMQMAMQIICTLF
jgi:hypothetical protein